MSHGGYIRSPGGHIRSHWALQEDSGHLIKKVFHLICVLQAKVARDGPGLTRERRDDDYSVKNTANLKSQKPKHGKNV